MLEAGPQVGHAVRQWTILFRLGDKAVERLLTITGWNSPDPHVYPTGAELIEHYLEPLATRTSLKEVVRS